MGLPRRFGDSNSSVAFSVFRFPLEPPFNVDCTSHSEAKQKKIRSRKWLGNPMKKFMAGTALVEREKPEVEE